MIGSPDNTGARWSQRMTETTANPEACLIIIGNEILSGRTKDANLPFLGAELNKLGIQMLEARVVADIESEIIEALNILRAKYDYVFTTGGIGPTHDDITAESVAKAFAFAIIIAMVGCYRGMNSSSDASFLSSQPNKRSVAIPSKSMDVFFI